MHLAPLDEQLGQLLLGELLGGGEPALLLDGGELVGRQEGDRGAVVHEVVEDRQRGARQDERQPGALGVVDQPVAQAEVEQRVLPLLDAHRLVGAVRGRRRRLGCRRRRAVQGRPVLDDLQDAGLVPRAGGQRHDAVAAGPVDVGDAEDPVELAGQPLRVRGLVQVGAGLAHAREQGGLDQADQPEVDQVDQRRRVGGRGGLGAALLAPVAEEGVAFGQPQQRPDAGLLQGGSEDDDGVQRGADEPGEDVAGRADLLAEVGPARGRLAVADAAPLHGVGERRDDRVDPLRAVRVAVDRAVAGLRLEDRRRLGDQRRDRRVVRHDVRGEHLQRQRQGSGQPLLGGEDLDVAAGLADQFAVQLDLDVDDAGALFLDVQHRGRVHDQAEVGEDRRPALVEVDEPFDGAGDRALGVADAEPHRGAPDGRVGGQREPVDDRDAVVRQRVAEHRGRRDLDGDRRPRDDDVALEDVGRVLHATCLPGLGDRSDHRPRRMGRM